jgi:hypothetical protein
LRALRRLHARHERLACRHPPLPLLDRRYSKGCG